MFWKLPKMWILVSASTMRVLVAFSIVYFVLPLCGLWKHKAAAAAKTTGTRVNVVRARVSRAAGENNPAAGAGRCVMVASQGGTEGGNILTQLCG